MKTNYEELSELLELILTRENENISKCSAERAREYRIDSIMLLVTGLVTYILEKDKNENSISQ